VIRTILFWLICLPASLLTPAALADSGGDAASGAHGIDPMVLGGIAILLMIAKLGGEFFERFKQPAVLGELIGGIIIGNLALAGFTGFEPLKTNAVIGALAEIGVIILLFEVGLESNVREMLEVGWSSLLVAVAGVIAPFFSAGAWRPISCPGKRRSATSSSARRFAPPASASPRACSKTWASCRRARRASSWARR
jgi:hypothetical protein